ncbi:MAG: Gfo/Idh/MocA family oxidoreductase [Lentisphaerae bacterium]|jgi:predicted dehydrogenase|nr:Gfo/Idh/MocA family oxidoreductase [Lentisphaerota bacterium]
MDRVKVGFIGCGGIAQYHFGHFEKMKEKAQIVAACDLDESRAQKTIERFQGARKYTDYKVMFDKEKLDAVFVCVQPGAHDGMEFIAIEKGINIFCQKPMTLDLSYAKKVLSGIKKKKLISAVGLQCRYADTFDFLKSYFAGRISRNEIAILSCYRLGGFPMVWWWRRMNESGGQAVEQTIHNFDLCRYLFGEVVQVQSARRRGVITDIPDNDVDDASSTIMTFANGIIGTFNTGCFGAGPGDINAFTRNGKISVGLGGNYKIEEPNRVFEGRTSNDYGQECDETFIDAVRGEIDREEILSPYSDAIKSLALTLAINESMDNGGMPVKPAL